jgi:hypothetical protein
VTTDVRRIWKKIPKLALLALSVAYLLIGATWTARSFGYLTPYGDTFEYIRLSQGMQVDEYRGVLYPFLLHWMGGGDQSPFNPLPIQIVQTLLFAVSLAYFFRIAFGVTFFRRRHHGQAVPLWAVGTFCLLALDPLISHFNLSVMTDSLCLSCVLVFCSTLGDMATRRRRLWVPASLCLVSFVAAANLRVEKLAVLSVTALFSCVAWWMLGRRAGANPVLRGTIYSILLIIGTGSLATFAIRHATYRYQGRWDTVTTVLNQRVIYPHLADIYDQLPGDVKSRLSPEDARKYDKRIHNTWDVINQISGRNAAVRQNLTEQMSRVAIQQRWPQLAASICADTVEHLLATPSFYARLALWMAQGKNPSAFRDEFQAVPFTYSVFAYPYRLLSFVYMLVAGAMFGIVGILAIRTAWIRRPIPRSSEIPARAVMLWTPVVLFWVSNAMVFSLTASLVHIRWVLFSHFICLSVIYSVGLCAVLPITAEESSGKAS